MIQRRYLGLMAIPALLLQCHPSSCDIPPPPVPTTSVAPGAYAFLFTDTAGRPARWDPCDAPIRYEIDGRAGTADELAAIGLAVASVAAASGHAFQLVGTSSTGVRSPGTEAMIGYRQSFPSAGQIGEGSIEVAGGTVEVIGGRRTSSPGWPATSAGWR